MAEVTILEQPQAPTPKRQKRKRRKRLSQIADWQDLLLNGAKAEDCPLQAIASGANAWCSMEAMRRDILGLGKPKPVEPVNATKASKRKPAVPVPL